MGGRNVLVLGAYKAPEGGNPNKILIGVIKGRVRVGGEAVLAPEAATDLEE